MKIGLVTDIHNHAVHLRGTPESLEHEQVDQIVVIGDTFEGPVFWKPDNLSPLNLENVR